MSSLNTPDCPIKYFSHIVKKHPALQNAPPAAGRVSDIFLSAAVRIIVFIR